MKKSTTKDKKRSMNWIDEAFDEAFKGRTQKPLTRKHNRASIRGKFWRGLTNKGVQTVDKIKTTINKTPKFVSLVILGAGFIYAAREVAQNNTVLTLGSVLLALLLIEKASK